MRKILTVCLSCCGVGLVALVVLLVIVQVQARRLADTVVTERGIVFGTGGGQPLKLDLTRPKEGKGLFPALVLVHGGGWVGGGREDYRTFMEYFTREGIVCISVDYRLAPKDRFPAQLEDVKCAVRWLRANAARYHVDPNRIGALGGSAGAHLVAMLGTTAGDKRFEGSGGNPNQSSAICAMVCMSGAYDLSVGYRDSVQQKEQEGKSVRGMLEALLGAPLKGAEARYSTASPINYVSKKTVPTLLTHGTADPLVPIEQSELFYAKLKSAGVDLDYMRIDGGGHADFGKHPQEGIDRIVGFVRTHLLK